MDNNQANFDSMTGEPIRSEDSNVQENNKAKKDTNTVKIVLLVLGGVFLLIIIFVIALFCFLLPGLFKSSHKLECKSNLGNITLMYSDKEIIGYTATGSLTYNLQEQKSIANQIGTEAYMNQFEIWFRQNTAGSCQRK